MAGLAAVLAGVWAYRKQRLSERDDARAEADQTRADADQARADEAQFTQRYSTAAEQLGHDKAAVRLAGVFAMARLADDWSKQRQQCIDVLCAYLRMLAEHSSGSETEVRATIVRTIAAHLRDDSAISWVRHDFDFTGAALHDAEFDGVTFCGKTSFFGAKFSGGHTSFGRTTFSGYTSFDQAEFSDGQTSFGKATFSGKYISFDGAEFSGGHTLFSQTEFSGAYAGFDGVKFSGGYMGFDGVKFSGERISFEEAEFSGERISFEEAEFSGERISFGDATFSGGHTSFSGVTFSGGTTADEATARSSFVGTTILWGPISPHPPVPVAAGTQ